MQANLGAVFTNQEVVPKIESAYFCDLLLWGRIAFTQQSARKDGWLLGFFRRR